MKKRVTQIDDFVFRLVDDHLFEVAMMILLVISALIRVYLTPITSSGDFNTFLLSWIEEYQKIGVTNGLSVTIGDYYVPYNLIIILASVLPWSPYVTISLISCMADYCGAYYIYKISLLILNERKADNSNHKAQLIAVIMLLPFVILDSAMWKQCDSIYVCLMIIALYMLFIEKYTAMFFFYSLSFCFKLQAVFMLPFLIIFYMIGRKYSIFEFIWIPAMYLFTGLPCVLMKRGLKATYGVYFNQTSEWRKMSLNFPNIYKLGLSDFDSLSKPAILSTIAIFIIATLFCYHYRCNFNIYRLVMLCAWGIWTCCMFLPSMHERYDYAAILLITAGIMSSGRFKYIWIAIVMNACEVMTYSIYLFASDVNIVFISVMYCTTYFVATFLMAKELSGYGAVGNRIVGELR